MKIEKKGYSNDEKTLDRIKREGIPVVIGGEGSVGQAVAQKLRDKGINEYVFRELMIDESDKLVFLNEIPYEQYYFLYGFLGIYDRVPDKIKKPQRCKGILYLTELYDTDPVSFSYLSDNIEQFDWVYSKLEDNDSRLAMEAYLNAKINEDAGYLRGLVVKPQYFGVPFLPHFSNETFVDCGAYDGDSIREFLKWSDSKYDEIIAFEPDEDNSERLEEYVTLSRLHDVKVIQCGAFDKETELHFQQNMMMSRVSESGEMTIRTKRIDDVVKDKNVSFIKMDIEGAELPALKGAEKTIIRCHPTLAISAYHKKDDLFVLAKFVLQCWEGYKLYFRLHKELPIDAVLYAVK